jgi:hypothetical protein
MRRKSHNNLQNLKTLSDRVSDAEKPQLKYMKLAILELEKVGRSKEKTKPASKCQIWTNDSRKLNPNKPGRKMD